MIILDCVQGSPEWEAVRLGRPTASQVDRIITPKKLTLSSQATTYRNQLLAEWLLGYAIDWGGQSAWMDRGRGMEAEARAWYELQRDVEVRQVGFLLRDDEQFGGSPDGLVGDDGILEIKCPAIHTHIGYMIAPETLAAEYRGQGQALLGVSSRQWTDLVSYNPELPPVTCRLYRDDDYIAALDRALNQFVAWLAEAKEKLAEHRAERLEEAARWVA